MNAELPVTTMIIGPRRHGVVRHALRTASDVGASVRMYRSVAGCPLATVDTMGETVHVHYTDRLFGVDANAAATNFDLIFRDFGGRLLVSLHDVPFDDRTAHSARRAAAYRCVIALADTVVVASEAERGRVQKLAPAARACVVRMPIRMSASELAESSESAVAADAVRDASVGIIGWIYPGKGHAAAIEAASHSRSCSRVVAAGTFSPGHRPLVRQLREAAALHRVTLDVTGHISDPAMDAVARQVAVPLVASTTTSASASLNTWLEAGRRPLVARTAYTVEFEHCSPDSIELYDSSEPNELAARVRHAIDDPSSTWCRSPLAPALSVQATVAALRDVYGDSR